MLLAIEIAILDIIDEFGPSTLEDISIHTFCPLNELIQILEKLQDKDLIYSEKYENIIKYYNK